jgi:hypothetical protein
MLLTLEDIHRVLVNEYNSGCFRLDGEQVTWTYSSEGVDSAREAEDRWLSYLGAKITAEMVIENSEYTMKNLFETQNRIGFAISKN